MTNDEIRRNDKIRMTKPATAQLRVFDIRASDFFRHWSFVIQRLVQVRFMVPMHARMASGRSMNRPGHRIGACFGKAALKTHALQTLRDCSASPNRAKRLECVRFIGAFGPARDGQRFRVPMHVQKRKGAFHEADGKNNASLRLSWRFLTLTLNRRGESRSKITSKSKT